MKELLEAGLSDEARDLVYELIDGINSTARCVPQGVAKEVTDLLRDYTMFPELEAVARSIREFDDQNPRAHVQYAQALIEQKRITTAIEALLNLKASLEQKKDSGTRMERAEATRELPEVTGLLGRSYKQLYVDDQPMAAEPRLYDLERSIEFYTRLLGMQLLRRMQ